MKNLFIVALMCFLGLIGCEKAEERKVQNEIDPYGVELGTIKNYDGTDCTVTIKKQASTRTNFIDEVYEISVEKPGKEDLELIITMEEFPGENQFVFTQYDEFWNEIVSMVYTDRKLTDIIINDDIPIDATTSGFRSWLACTVATYHVRKQRIQDDETVDVLCDLSNIAMGSCTIGTLLSAATHCL